MKTKPNSYFLFFYVGSNDKGQLNGNCALEFKSTFPNNQEATKYIMDNFKVNKLAFTGILKLSKSDFEEWIRQN